MNPRDTVARVAPGRDDRTPGRDEPDSPAPGRDEPDSPAPGRDEPDPSPPDAPVRGATNQGLRALGRDALARAEREPPAPAGARDPGPSEPETVRSEDKKPTVDLARGAWLVTVLACLLAVTILVLQGYLGYAGVTLAVAVAAGINLL
jgi:hypothetical protein